MSLVFNFISILLEFISTYVTQLIIIIIIMKSFLRERSSYLMFFLSQHCIDNKTLSVLFLSFFFSLSRSKALLKQNKAKKKHYAGVGYLGSDLTFLIKGGAN
jgi:hypothetical protein